MTAVAADVAVLEPTDKEKAEKGMFATIEIGYHLVSNPEKKEEAKPFQIEIGAGDSDCRSSGCRMRPTRP